MKKILQIEDEQDQVKMIAERLKMEGYELISAVDGEEGLKKAEETKPDLVLLDHFLPKMKGFEVCRKMKSNPKTKDIPVIMITASGVEHLDSQCREAGADFCIKKPFDTADLVAKVKVLLGEIKE